MLLIIEDDPHYARILLGLARDKGFKGIVATEGRAWASRSPGSTGPRPSRSTSSCPTCSAGRCSTSSSSTRPRATSRCRSSRVEEERQHGLAHGAFAYLVKAADHRRPGGGVRPHQGLHRAAHQAAAGRRGQRHRAAVHRRAARLRRHRDGDGRHRRGGAGGDARPGLRLRRARPAPARHDRLRAAGEDARRARRWPTCRSSSSPARTSTPTSAAQLKTMAKSIVLKDVQSPERLLDETALFLHRVVTDLPPEKQQMLERLHGSQRGPARPQGAGGR